MLDDSLRLQENPHLLALFSHYAQMGTEGRATCQELDADGRRRAKAAYSPSWRPDRI